MSLSISKEIVVPDKVSVYIPNKLAELTADSLTFGETVYADGAITGPINFTHSPTVPEPLDSSEAANKKYVDDQVGQRSGGLTLFLNYDGVGILSPIPCSCPLQTITTTGSNTGVEQTIASFTTVDYPGVKTLPVGNISWTQYGNVNTAAGTVFYKFKLYKVSSGVASQISTTSETSAQVNSLFPNTYTMSITMSVPVVLELTDLLRVDLIHAGESDAELSTYFNAERFSYIQTTLVAGTSLLSSDNTWTTSNHFPTPLATENSTIVATTAFVTSAVSASAELLNAAIESSSGSSSGTPLTIRPMLIVRFEKCFIPAPTATNTWASIWIAPNQNATLTDGLQTPVTVIAQSEKEIWLPTITSENNANFDGFTVNIRSDNTVIPSELYTNYWSILSTNNVYMRHVSPSGGAYLFKKPLQLFTTDAEFNLPRNILRLTTTARCKFVAFVDHLGEWCYLYMSD